MLNIFKKKESFISPISGKLIPITEVNDPVFSQKMMGDGFAILPTGNKVYAPMSGVVSFCFPTNHAVGIQASDGTEILIHIGINTVEMKGNGFQSFITQNQKIQQGDALVEFDLDLVRSNGYDPTVMVIFPKNTVSLSKDHMDVENKQPILFKLK